MSYSRVRAWDPEQQKMGWVMRWGGVSKPKTRKKTIAAYRPLHPKLTVKDSPIDGLGIFATADISSGTVLGISHVEQSASASGRYHCGYIRTPLGGFINHSDTPNCVKLQVDDDDSHRPLPDRLKSSTMSIMASRDIKAGEELTVFYTLYKLPRSG